MMRLLMFLTALSCAVPCPALAEQYWIAYEGNDFPENEDWTRVYGDGNWPPEDEPDRRLQNGELVIDTSRDDQLWEYYSHPLTDPGPGEVFVAEWRVVSEILVNDHDNGVVFARDAAPAHISFHLTPDSLRISHEDLYIPITPGLRHTYRVESQDMISYAVWIDEELVHTGTFETDTLLQSYAGWGAGTQGASSVSRWDYFRFGVVPEPSSGLLFGCCLWLLRARSRKGELQ
jgi:hypothetical protein